MPEVALQKIDFGGARSFTGTVYEGLRPHLGDAGARILTAHVALSTGWGKSVLNYNLAGMKASPSWRATKPFAVARGCECVAGLMNNADPNCGCSSGKGQKYTMTYWRAYNSFSDGVDSLVATLRAPRYASSWNMLLQGNTEYFAQVGRDGWYTADPTKVKTSMLRFYKQVNNYLGAADGGISVAALALGGAYLLWSFFT